MLTKRNKVERMTIVNTLLTGIYEELLKGETDDIDGLLQIAVYAQVEMNRIVFDLNQRNGCEPTADTPQTEKAERIPFDPLVEMDIKRMVEERLRQKKERSE